MYKEARDGYIEAAKVAVTRRIEQLRDNRVVNLHFSLRPPEDHTSVYDTAITMVELHQDSTLTLSAQEVRMLVQDEWDWTNNWLVANSAYSADINETRMNKGL